jgi:hypothetical protein
MGAALILEALLSMPERRASPTVRPGEPLPKSA